MPPPPRTYAYAFTCRNCSTTFQTNRRNQCYCSMSCGQDHRRLSKLAEGNAYILKDDLPPHMIEQRYQAHMRYLRATRKYSVDPFEQSRQAGMVNDD